MPSRIFEDLQNNIKPENKQFVEKNLAISKQVRHILASHATIKTQKDLAAALNKEPSEISKWLSGLHNIGLENITKMEAVLGCDIILTDEQAKEKYSSPYSSNYKVFQRVQFSGSSDNFEVPIEPISGNTLLPARSAIKKRHTNKKNRSKLA